MSSGSDTRTIPFGRPWLDESDRRAVAEVLEGHVLTHGPRCAAFESGFAEFLGPQAHAVTLSSCMAALHLSYLRLGLKPGDEVVVPAMTHVATAHAVEWVGATPVFVDPEPETGNLTAERIEAALTERTRAISVVHYLGIPCAMPAVVDLARRHSLAVVEDCALAVGARYDGVHVGLFGGTGCFSFYPVKHLTTAEGGMLVSTAPDVVAEVSRLRAFGVDRRHDERTVPGLYDVPTLGLNYRMSELQAALGRAQLAKVEENLARRGRNFALLKEGLLTISGVRVLDAADRRAANSHYCLAVVLEGQLRERRAELIAALNGRGVGTSLYYPQPVPRMTYYRDKYGYDGRAFPNATEIADRSIALPVGPHLDSDDMTAIVEALAASVQELG